MATYNTWSKFYDEIYGDRTKDIAKIKSLIKKYHPSAKTVLDMACGTGTLTNGLAQDYEVEGLDFSEGQIAVAQSNFPNITFHNMDMANFELDKKFDVITCLFNSINHLTNFDSWIKTFKAVNKHMNADGIFVFDVSTKYKLERLSKVTGSLMNEFGDESFRLINISKEKEDLYHWNIKVFEHINDNNYKLHEDVVPELVVSLDDIKKTLNEHFSSLIILDKSGSEVNEESSVVFFICKQ